MVRGIGLPVDPDIGRPRADVGCDEKEVAAVRAVRPLSVIVNAAGRVMGLCPVSAAPGVDEPSNTLIE